MSAAPIRARDVVVELGGQRILRGVDLDVARGQFVTILGANGSGKSTLVRAVVGLTPHRGRIEIFGTELARFTEHARWGYMPQRPEVSAGVPATVTEVVLSGLLVRRPRWGWPTRAERRTAAALIERVGLADHANRPISQLSGGQQQRAHIARSLVASPELLVMDEPTAGVDAHSVAVFADLLAEVKAEGTAILLVAHELGPLTPLIDRSVHLDHGLVEYEGPGCGPVEDHHHHDHDHLHTSEPTALRPLPEEGPFS